MQLWRVSLFEYWDNRKRFCCHNQVSQYKLLAGHAPWPHTYEYVQNEPRGLKGSFTAKAQQKETKLIWRGRENQGVHGRWQNKPISGWGNQEFHSRGCSGILTIHVRRAPERHPVNNAGSISQLFFCSSLCPCCFVNIKSSYDDDDILPSVLCMSLFQLSLLITAQH